MVEGEMSKVSEQEKVEALERLHEWLKPGDTVFTVLRHRSASGMLRSISLLKVTAKGGGRSGEEPDVLCFDGNAVRVGLGSYDQRHEGVRVGGCGMDMGFHLVYELSRALFKGGFGCVGKHCPSNDHSNGDRDRTPHGAFKPQVAGRDPVPAGGLYPEKQEHEHWHRDGGYALRHRWL
jgi:hypothetical protein